MARQNPKTSGAGSDLFTAQTAEANKAPDSSDSSKGKRRFNMTNVEEDKGFAAVPAGVYDCRVHDVKFKYSNSSGNPMWEVVLETLDKVNDRFARFWQYVVWTDDHVGRAKRFLMRVAPDVLESPLAQDLDPEDEKIINMVISKECRARVTVEKYEGVDRNRVRDILPPASGGDFF